MTNERIGQLIIGIFLLTLGLVLWGIVLLGTA